MVELNSTVSPVEKTAQQSELTTPAIRAIRVVAGKKVVVHDITQESFTDIQTNRSVFTNESLSTDKSLPTHQTTEIFVEDQAEVLLIYEQESAPEIHMEHNYRLVLGRDAKATIFFLVQGSASCVLSCDVLLEKEGASVQAHGLYFVKDKRTVDIKMRQQHRAQNTKSEVVVKGILFDEAKSLFSGTIGIDAIAKNSNAVLHNKNLVVGEKARAISKPCLEVLADAVQCKHGSAVGSFDTEHLFYLSSRGLSEGQAKNELLKAFVQEIINSLPDQKIKSRWQEKIDFSCE